MSDLSTEELAALGSLVMFRLSADLTARHVRNDKALNHDLKKVKVDNKTQAGIRKSLANPMDVENKFPSGDIRTLYDWMFDFLLKVPGKLVPIEINPPWPPDMRPVPSPPPSPRCPKLIYYMRLNLRERLFLSMTIASLELWITNGVGTVSYTHLTLPTICSV